MSDERLTEEKYQSIKKRIARDWVMRCLLAEMAGHKANPKNIMALMDTEFDLNIRELYLEVQFRKPENAAAALHLIQEFYKEINNV